MNCECEHIYYINLVGQVTYHELQPFNGDSSSLVVADTSFSLDQLQPGRNYSIAVAALSNNMESVAVPRYQATSE